MSRDLWDLLAPQRPTEIVDIGANPIDGDPPYKPLLAGGLCRVTGFEPQESALAELERMKGPDERYLPYVIGDGETHTLHICSGSGMTSLFEPDPSTLVLFDGLRPLSHVRSRVMVETRRLDDVPEIKHLDFLKIDIQGGELAAFRNGRVRLAGAVAIQTEVSFITLYRNQPAFGEVDMELRSQGFLPHCFAAVKRWPISPYGAGVGPARNQLLEADIVYVRDFSRPDSMSNEQLKHLTLIAHCCYGSIDLAMRCVMFLELRGALELGTLKRYLELCRNNPLL